MSKRKKPLLALLICFLLVSICIYLARQQRQNIQQIPEEISTLIESYMTAYKRGTKESVEYMHFEDDFRRSAYIKSGDMLIAYEIKDVEKINDNLYVLTALMKTRSTMFHLGDKYNEVYNFVVQIDGNWFYTNGIANIPSKLQTNLDINNYTYSGDDIISRDDVLEDALEFEE